MTCFGRMGDGVGNEDDLDCILLDLFGWALCIVP